MKYRTTRAVRFAGRAYADNDPIPHPDDIGGFVDALFDKARHELLDMGAIVLDVDTVESLADRRNDLVRQLADAIGIAPGRLMVLPSPEVAGDYALKLDERGNWEIVPFAAINPLADADEATIRRHHLEALRDLDDLTYLALTDDVAGRLGEMVIFTVDPDSGVVVAVEARPASPAGVDVTPAPAAGTGGTTQPAGAADGAGAVVPPVVPADPVPPESSTRRGGRRPKTEADQ